MKERIDPSDRSYFSVTYVQPHSDGSLISQFNSNIQKQRNNSSLTCCFLYRMKLNLRSNRSEYFSLKSTETYISTDNFRPRISVFDWLIFCSGNLMLHLKKELKIIETQIL